MATLALDRLTAANINFLVASAASSGRPGFSDNEVVELLEMMLPSRSQALEPTWSPGLGQWHWQSVETS